MKPYTARLKASRAKALIQAFPRYDRTFLFLIERNTINTLILIIIIAAIITAIFRSPFFPINCYYAYSMKPFLPFPVLTAELLHNFVETGMYDG